MKPILQLSVFGEFLILFFASIWYADYKSGVFVFIDSEQFYYEKYKQVRVL